MGTATRLQKMVLHYIAYDAVLIKVPSAPGDANRLLHQGGTEAGWGESRAERTEFAREMGKGAGLRWAGRAVAVTP